jgi:hypothetical protein
MRRARIVAFVGAFISAFIDVRNRRADREYEIALNLDDQR